MLTITTPAESQQLLSQAQMRVAAGLASNDTSQDAALAEVGLRVAAEIAAHCGIAVGAGGAPTLNREKLTETFRVVEGFEMLVLSRRHDIAIESVTVDDIVLDAGDYEVEVEEGVLYRLLSDCQVRWYARKIVVVYQAGFGSVPPDLVGAATDLFRLRRSEGSRDPMVRAEETDVPDVLRERTEYWVGSVPGSSDSGMPTSVASRLSRFANAPVA